eukprot:CAMPEP_0118927404 /NCGR_PEP_ID=MMETSP1169-20130426/4883_1 /TAXON_ID=36882 /ORGANISM="Pyramimonas obovata, Strain CCMP722" /LENGTH=356 /DNA_ID=CAMNT_0006869151 /DNA_START=105 /DNA_END=1175 /DNA_ORIENTATION=+
MSRRDDIRQRSATELITASQDRAEPYKDKEVPQKRGHGGVLSVDSVAASRARSGIIALSYMACAILLIFFNKLALSSFKFPYSNLITLLQLICSNMLLALLVRLDVVSLTKEGEVLGSSPSQRFVPLSTLKVILPLSLAYLLYMVLGMASLKGVNLPMYTTLRRTTAAFTMSAEFALTGKRQPPLILVSVSLMVLGAIVAGLRDFSFDAWGYFVVFASNGSTALYLATISRLGKRTSLNSFGLMWCNGLICAPILLIVTFLNGDLLEALSFEYLHTLKFQLVLLLSCLLAFALNYTIFLNTAVNSALTQTVCGNLKDAVVIVIGFQSFSDARFDPINMVGILLGIAGSVMYAVLKL